MGQSRPVAAFLTAVQQWLGSQGVPQRTRKPDINFGASSATSGTAGGFPMNYVERVCHNSISYWINPAFRRFRYRRPPRRGRRGTIHRRDAVKTCLNLHLRRLAARPSLSAPRRSCYKGACGNFRTPAAKKLFVPCADPRNPNPIQRGLLLRSWPGCTSRRGWWLYCWR